MKDVKSTIVADNADRFAAGSVQVNGFAGLVGVEAEGTITVLDYEQLLGVSAEGDIIVTDWEELAGISITIGEDTIVEGVDFDAETSNNVTATNIAAAIDALAGVASTANTATVNVWASATGRAGNLIGTSTDAVAGLTIAEAHLLGGKDAATITVGEDELVEGTDFDAETSNNVTATNIAAAIEALAGYTAAAVGPVVTVTAAAIGEDGNVDISATWDEDEVVASPLTLVSLTGGLEEGVLTFDGTELVQGTDFDAETSDAVTATNLAAAIDGISGYAAEVDGDDDTLVLITADAAGLAGNVVMSSNSDALTLVQMSGGADYFYSDILSYPSTKASAIIATIKPSEIEETGIASGTLTIVSYAGLTGNTVTFNGTVLTEGVEWTAATSNNATATSLAAAINALAGFSATALGAVVTVVADEAGEAGNVAMSQNGGGDMTLSGATLTGGVNFVINAFIEVSHDNDTWSLTKDFDPIVDTDTELELLLTDIRSFMRIGFVVTGGTATIESVLKVSEFGGDRDDPEETDAESVDDTTEDEAPVASKVYAYLRAWSGSAWQSLRSGVKAVTTSIVGYLAVVPFAVYQAVATVRTEGQSGPLQQDINGNLLTASGAHVTGEDQDIDRMMVVGKYAYNPPIVADAQVSAAPYILHTINISPNDATPTAGQIDIYDNTVTGGTKIFSIAIPAAWFAPFTLTFDIETTLGLYIDFTTVADVNVAVSGMAAE